MKGWPTIDGNLILIFEILLMLAFLTMNASDSILQNYLPEKYIDAGYFPVSNFLPPVEEIACKRVEP